VALAGAATALAGVLVYTGVDAGTGPWLLAGGMFVVGLGHGMLIPSLIGDMYRGLDRTDVPAATTASNVLIRIGSSVGIAVLAVVLQGTIRDRVPGTSGSLADVAALPRTPSFLSSVADAFAYGFWWVMAIVALSVVPALLLPGRDRRDAEAGPGTDTDADTARIGERDGVCARAASSASTSTSRSAPPRPVLRTVLLARRAAARSCRSAVVTGAGKVSDSRSPAPCAPQACP
jgi:hypothetical protein